MTLDHKPPREGRRRGAKRWTGARTTCPTPGCPRPGAGPRGLPCPGPCRQVRACPQGPGGPSPGGTPGTGQGVAGAVLLLPGCLEGVDLVPLSPGQASLNGGVWHGLCWGYQVNADPREVGSLASASHLPGDPAPFLDSFTTPRRNGVRRALSAGPERWGQETRAAVIFSRSPGVLESLSRGLERGRGVHSPWSVCAFTLSPSAKASGGLGRPQVSRSAACLPQLRGPR